MSFDPTSPSDTALPIDITYTPAPTQPITELDQPQHGSTSPDDSSFTGTASPSGSLPCHVHQLSIELLARIFARLDPVSLSVAAATCHYWRHIIMDDVCWKNAFLDYFGKLPYRRLRSDTWKAEYILRTHLVRKWDRGRGANLSIQPKIGSIDCTVVDYQESFMMAASHDQAVAVQCNPSTGKLDRHRFYGWEDDMQLPVGVIKMDSHRIFWGLTSGYLNMTVRGKNLSRHQLKSFSDFHQGPISALCLPKLAHDIVLSGGDDGMIRIWHIPSLTSIEQLYGSTSRTTCLEATVDHHVVAGFDNGMIVIWDVRLNKLNKVPSQDDEQDDNNEPEAVATRYQRRWIATPKMDQNTPVQSVTYYPAQQWLLVVYTGLNCVYVYDVHTCQCITTFGQQVHTLGTISASTSDLDTRLSFTDSSLLDCPAVFAKKTSRSQQQKKKKADEASPSQPQPTGPSDGKLAASSTPPRPMALAAQSVLFATGDTLGTVALWSLPLLADHVNSLAEHRATAQPLPPYQLLRGLHQAAISTLYLDSFKLVAGADDGWIRFADPLTGQFLHAIGHKIPRHAPVDRSDMSVMRVKTLVCDEYRGVATVGHQIKTWDFSQRFVHDRRRLLNKKSGGSSGASPALRDHLHFEIKQDLLESQHDLAQERRAHERHAKHVDAWTMGGMSEEEMVAYAMMLSQEQPSGTESFDESLTTAAPSPFQSSQPVQDAMYSEDEALLQAVLASLEMQDSHRPDHSSPGLPQIDDLDQWPTIGSTPSTSSPPPQDTDDDDAELQRILKLSEIEK
ncbi:WD40 repeat-like protein [Hesseltinella vesiculosa]|uniref:WD40 repeat-like protein n=1 Tax=Hesseltinella vesiculosa TaxID=101127 RepID=A0A1X2GNU6_9FUNG|nr:WD40 repeat-like protein [Hesseltinella vesiculosa]